MCWARCWKVRSSAVPCAGCQCACLPEYRDVPSITRWDLSLFEKVCKAASGNSLDLSGDPGTGQVYASGGDVNLNDDDTDLC